MLPESGLGLFISPGGGEEDLSSFRTENTKQGSDQQLEAAYRITLQVSYHGGQVYAVLETKEALVK
ncbi:hypothetical protein J6590_019868 [Homalodisca vitripennis]|nr:hypothetical protein J6590_019868 [Homalodisca vitripennis]